MRRTLVVAVTTTFWALGSAGAAGSAVAMPAPETGAVGFATSATGTPIKVDIYEPAIPIPSSPQAELNLSYSHVEGTTGPAASARSSALWPGDAIGEGFTTIGGALGLPAQLTKDGYPVQANAQTPGGPSSAKQEPIPGVVSRVKVSGTQATAKAGYDSAGDVTTAPKSKQPKSPLPGLPSLPAPPGGSSGSLGHPALSASAPAPDPLGKLAAVVDAGSATSLSQTTYAAKSVNATSVSTLHDVRILGGLIQLKSMTVTASTDSSLAGAKNHYHVTYGGLSVAGTPFEVTPKGVEAPGHKMAIPGLPTDPGQALKALGITFSRPAPKQSTDGVHGTLDVRGLKLTIDTGPLRSKLPSLPLGQVADGLPDSAGQLKGLLLALNEAHPKFVIYLGTALTDAATVPPVSFGAASANPGGTSSASAPVKGSSGASSSSSGGSVPASSGGATTSGAPAGQSPASSTPIRTVSAIPGLPPLGSVPGMLLMGGIVLAGGAGWWLRRIGGTLLGGSSSCPHGLKSGVPDLRKA